MSAVAIATPKIAELIFSFFVLAMINATPPQKAIKTSLISGLVLDSNSEVSSLIWINAKKNVSSSDTQQNHHKDVDK